MAAKLEKSEIERRLSALPGWEYKDNAISKLYRFKEFMDGIRFLNKVAEMAEAADRHPDVMKIEYTRITFSFTRLRSRKRSRFTRDNLHSRTNRSMRNNSCAASSYAERCHYRKSDPNILMM
jgi:4a-hydroxytetrahydrobiopterin dehydratase